MTYISDQIRGIRESAALYPASENHWGQFEVRGADAASFLHRMLSNEVKNLKIGEGRYQALLDRKAMVQSLFYLIRLESERFLAITPPSLTQKTFSTLNKMKFIEKVVLTDVSHERGLITVIGPKAAEALSGLNLPSEANLASEATGIVTWREDIFAFPVFHVSFPKEENSKIADLSSKTIPLSEEGLKYLWMISGFPEYGRDLGDQNILLETPIPVAHQRNKGCYPGQEVVERISTYGKGRTPKRLCRLSLAGEYHVSGGAEIYDAQGQKVGTLTSSFYDPLYRKTLLLAYIDQKHTDKTAISCAGERLVLD